jgi:Family of unknown function (DUF5682)
MPVVVLGIRHHGVGSAKNVVAMLEKLRPDLLFVEGPPELDAVSQWVGHEDLVPPASVLCYDQDRPNVAVFYPFSEFSPEWQAISYANRNKIPVRMLDLPLSIAWATPPQAEEADAAFETEAPDHPPAQTDISGDPIAHFARIAGYDDADLWWEHHFEHRFWADAPDAHFEAVMLMMRTLREGGISSSMDLENTRREAWMAQMIRKAQNELYGNIAVVCGAWHGPALSDLDKTEKAHAKILKTLPKSKIKVAATWIPWTNDRLSMAGGYGAGIASPGWYGHLWRHPDDLGERWLSSVAGMFREKKIDISTAHVIEAQRLACMLAALRERARPGLAELNEAVQTVMCMGDSVLLELVRKELIVGFALGQVPAQLPRIPLQADFEEQTRLLKLPQSAEKKELVLDLRKDLDLRRSIFLHRLIALEFDWCHLTEVRGKGTFKEGWALNWEPELLVKLLERGIWGNTIEEAASKFLLDRADKSNAIGQLADMIGMAIPAELFAAIELLLIKINDLSVVSHEIIELMGAAAPLVAVGRYGNVRKSDLAAVNTLAEGLLTRISLGLPNACYGLDEARAHAMFGHIRKTHDAVRLLERPPLAELWRQALAQLATGAGVHAVVAGCTCRLLFDTKAIGRDTVETRFSHALSAGNAPAWSAGWLEGFLKSSGMILLYDDALWNLLYGWVTQLPEEQFVALLPILRRTFSKFEPGERRKLGEKAKKGAVTSVLGAEYSEEDFDKALAERALDLVGKMLGLQ